MQKTDKNQAIAILGISEQPDRYSFQASQRLLSAGFSKLYGISPKTPQIKGVKVFPKLCDLKVPIHTLTVYVGKERLEALIPDILRLAPRRIVLNPGTENEKLITEARQQQIEVICGCTLVMLSTNLF